VRSDPVLRHHFRLGNVITTVDAAPLMSMSPRPEPHGAVLPLVLPNAAVWVTGFSPACGATCDVRAAMA